MFERYNFSGIFIQIQAVLTLYAQGAVRTSCCNFGCISKVAPFGYIIRFYPVLFYIALV